jgi:hypothetical protein
MHVQRAGGRSLKSLWALARLQMEMDFNFFSFPSLSSSYFYHASG